MVHDNKSLEMLRSQQQGDSDMKKLMQVPTPHVRPWSSILKGWESSCGLSILPYMEQKQHRDWTSQTGGHLNFFSYLSPTTIQCRSQRPKAYSCMCPSNTAISSPHIQSTPRPSLYTVLLPCSNLPRVLYTDLCLTLTLEPVHLIASEQSLTHVS